VVVMLNFVAAQAQFTYFRLFQQSHGHLHILAEGCDDVHDMGCEKGTETVGYVEPYFRIEIKMNRFPVVLNFVQGDQVFVTVHTFYEIIYRLNKYNTFL